MSHSAAGASSTVGHNALAGRQMALLLQTQPGEGPSAAEARDRLTRYATNLRPPTGTAGPIVLLFRTGEAVGQDVPADIEIPKTLTALEVGRA